MLKRVGRHILTLHEKLGLLTLYGVAMFALGMGINYYYPISGMHVPESKIASPLAIPDKRTEAELLQQMKAPAGAQPTAKAHAPVAPAPAPAAAPQIPVATEEAKVEPVKTEKAPPAEEMEETPDAAGPGPGPQEAQEAEGGGTIVEPTPDPNYSEYIYDLTVEKGDTLTDMLIEAGVERQEAHLATSALQKDYDLRQLKVGQPIHVVFKEPANKGKEAGDLEFALLRIEEPDRIVELVRDAKGEFAVKQSPKDLKRQLVRAGGVITDSLYVLSTSLDIPYNVLQEAVNAYSFDVDFQRDIKQGNRFEVMYESYFDDGGKRVRDGNMVYALLTVGGRDLKIYRFSPTGDDKDAEYYTEDGQVLRKSLLKTPVNGAVVSSPFGFRRHPISGYTKMHKGVDFAAPIGTPIYAAGDGKIEKIGWNGGYGNFIKIWHDSEYSTAYGHISRFARGIKRDRHVRQGQVIAYVGSTGSSTGPHLHFEILHYGKQVNPMKVNLPPTRRLAGNDLKALKGHVSQVKEWLTATANAAISLPQNTRQKKEASTTPVADAALSPSAGPKTAPVLLAGNKSQ